mgnify:CR=1 FL=1|tara:strand:- start:5855 stop:6175 length:321 start_codon:yes stop_codon:yes gene_type:complete
MLILILVVASRVRHQLFQAHRDRHVLRARLMDPLSMDEAFRQAPANHLTLKVYRYRPNNPNAAVVLTEKDLDLASAVGNALALNYFVLVASRQLRQNDRHPPNLPH